MKIAKLLVLAMAMVAVGTLVLPSTVSLFAGQHYWYNLSGYVSGVNNVPCEKCHADVFEELDQSNFHIHWGDDTKADRHDCEACHRSNLSIQYALVNASYANYQPGKEAHAASVVACMMCHQNNSASATSKPGYYAGGFNITGLADSAYDYSNASYNGKFAAHNAFVARAINDSTLQDSNEACVACHTHAAVKINWTHARSLEFNVGLQKPVTTDTGAHNWNVTNWTYNGTANATSWGNTTGFGNTSYWSGWPGNVTKGGTIYK